MWTYQFTKRSTNQDVAHLGLTRYVHFFQFHTSDGVHNAIHVNCARCSSQGVLAARKAMDGKAGIDALHNVKRR